MIRTRKPFALLHTGLILLLLHCMPAERLIRMTLHSMIKSPCWKIIPKQSLPNRIRPTFHASRQKRRLLPFCSVHWPVIILHVTSILKKKSCRNASGSSVPGTRYNRNWKLFSSWLKPARRKNNTAEEIAAIEQGMKLAELADDPVWKFHLYNYLSDMYLRKYDMLKFIKNQALANQSIKEMNTDELDPAGKKLSVYRPACQSRNFTDPAQDIGQPATHLLHGYMPAAGNYLLQAEEMGKRCN